MGYNRLIESLRNEGQEKIKQIHDETEAQAQEIRLDTLRRIDELRKRYRNKETARIKEEYHNIVVEAENRGKRAKLIADKELCDRLFSIALSLLQTLRKRSYEDTFDSLVKEIPSQEWHVVRTNPEDVEIARGFFPGAEIIPDVSITGGMDVATHDGKVRVVNTFEKRLESIWIDIVPEVIREVYEEISRH